jgi:hypothetical protein
LSLFNTDEIDSNKSNQDDCSDQKKSTSSTDSKQVITPIQNFGLQGCIARGCESLLKKATSEAQLASSSLNNDEQLGKNEISCKIAQWESKIIKTEQIK